MWPLSTFRKSKNYAHVKVLKKLKVSFQTFEFTPCKLGKKENSLSYTHSILILNIPVSLEVLSYFSRCCPKARRKLRSWKPKLELPKYSGPSWLSSFSVSSCSHCSTTSSYTEYCQIETPKLDSKLFYVEMIYCLASLQLSVRHWYMFSVPIL